MRLKYVLILQKTITKTASKSIDLSRKNYCHLFRLFPTIFTLKTIYGKKNKTQRRVHLSLTVVSQWADWSKSRKGLRAEKETKNNLYGLIDQTIIRINQCYQGHGLIIRYFSYFIKLIF